MTELTSNLIADINKNGPITISDFFDTVAKHYYSKQQVIFGHQGDFITAPGVSQLFGEMIGIWLLSIIINNLPEAILVELGPGNGYMIQDIIKIMNKFDCHNDIYLFERSDYLRQKQHDTLAGYNNIKWFDNIEQLPHKPIILIANEFFDALSVEQAIFYYNSWYNRVINVKNNELIFNISDQIPLATIKQFNFPDKPYNNMIYEYSPARKLFFAKIINKIKRDNGLALIIDYGYDVDMPSGSTLQAVYRHNYCDLFANLGLADITAHVDFGALYTDLDNIFQYGPLNQGKFLRNIGIEQRLSLLAKQCDSKTIGLLRNEVDRLCNSEHMGDLFKCIVFTTINHIQGFESL